MDEGRLPRALTVAGSDSGGGAGIQADLKSFTLLGAFGTSALTAVTVQNTRGVQRFEALAPDLVAAQIDAILEDIGTDAAKTGMLANAAIIEAVADRLAHHRVDRLVVDPVMMAKGGAPLLEPAAIEVLRSRLLPLALLVTPNLPEAEALSGVRIRDAGGLREAGRRIAACGARAVLVKGGHWLDPAESVDYLFFEGEWEEFRAPRFPTRHTHGTGCTLSAAIAAGLARGLPLREAVALGKRFVTRALERAVPLGHGVGPTNHLAWLEPE